MAAARDTNYRIVIQYEGRSLLALVFHALHLAQKPAHRHVSHGGFVVSHPLPTGRTCLALCPETPTDPRDTGAPTREPV